VYSGHSTLTSIGLFAGCYPTPRYWATSLINGRNAKHGASGIVHPGDTVRLYLYESAQRSYISLIDETSRIGWHRSGPGAGHLNSPHIGDSDWTKSSGGAFPVPDFGSMRFTRSTMNNRPLGSVTRLGQYNMTTDSGRIEIVTDPITSGQRAFTTTYVR
jgi:hypothetical protein